MQSAAPLLTTANQYPLFMAFQEHCQ